MALLVNLHHLEKADVRLQGELPVEELELGKLDELITVRRPLHYDFEVHKVAKALLVRGRLWLDLDCACARCLKPYSHRLDLSDWACDLPMEGEEQVPVANDCVDLTPVVREDILLALPLHPVCKGDCGGLPAGAAGKTRKSAGAAQTKEMPSAWSELNKLKF
jgi:uncharacterized metal-binding protein YceD (DUF177 family)